MAFPANPTNNQTVTVNGVLYTYNSTKGAWSVTTNSGVDYSVNTLNAAGGITISATTASTSTSTGALKVSGGVGISGALNATSKSFLIPHPTKNNMVLRYGSLEGPEFGVYVRGRSNNDKISLPDYWKKLINPETITVTLTPIGSYQKLYVTEIKDNTVFVANATDTTIDYYYVVYAERIDIDKLVVEFVDNAEK